MNDKTLDILVTRKYKRYAMIVGIEGNSREKRPDVYTFECQWIDL